MQLVLTTVHFGINVFVALVFFSVSWLYFDAASGKKRACDIWKIVGFLLLSFAYLVHAVYVESGEYFSVNRFATIVHGLYLGLSVTGGSIVIVGLLLDPILPKPRESLKNAFIFPIGVLPSLLVAKAEIMLGIMLLYLRRHTKGLEKHLFRVVLACMFFFISDVLESITILRSSTDIRIYEFVAPFGVLWIVQHAVLFCAALLLRSWVFTYLLKRIATQLFMIGSTAIVALCIVVTMIFSTVLFVQIEKTTAEGLTTNASMLTYAIENLKSAVLTDAQLVAQNPGVVPLMTVTKRAELNALVTSVLYAKKKSDVIIVDTSQRVIARGMDSQYVGTSLSDDTFIKKALEGKEHIGFVVSDGVVSPRVSIVAAVPIFSESNIVGAVEVIHAIDASFLQGIRQSIGMGATIFAGSTVSATSLDIPGYVGSEESQSHIIKTLTEKTYVTGKTRIFNVPYIAAYVRLLGAEGQPVGMVSVATPEKTMFSLAGRSIELTFISVILLLLISLIPIYKTAKNIEKQFS